MPFKKLNIIFAGVFAILFLECNTGNRMAGFDDEQWRKDINGCNGSRKALAEAMMQNKKKWVGMDDDDLLKLLGTPDKKFYYERNAKAFAYFIESGGQCHTAASNPGREGKKLIAEINAIGFVHLIHIEL